MTACRTVSVSIQRAPDEVYAYLLDAITFPQWSAFITAIERAGETWQAKTPHGTVQIRFEPRNGYRVLDHSVTAHDGKKVWVPLRVLPNGPDGSEVMFSVFRQPEMSDEEFDADVGLVRADLASLKKVLEA
ncbi:MAG TPA: SRPBCC family protein [Opitutus sp.]|nr:SRPBCC family protein [Opitutus sp.]